MITISVINSHAFGAGIFLALAHDYTLMNPSRGWWCLPEVDLGVAIPSTITVLLKAKIANPHVYRDATLEGARYSGPQALERGLVDALGGIEEAIKMAEEKKFVAKANGGAVGGLKEDAWREVLDAFAGHNEQVAWREKIENEKDGLQKAADARIAAFEKKSKL
jgi:enoyl-CoA hydratase/carnithine racemase